MKISFSATNPCHVYPMAQELASRQALGGYYSGYPQWKLGDVGAMNVRTHSLRTNVVYGLLKFVPERFRPSSRSLFLWQDQGFDRWVGRHLEPCDFVHGLPGQCLHTFRAARRLGIRTVLNHATGPVRDWVRIMEPEYARIGLKLSEVCPYDDDYFRREDEEYALTDWHCAASTVVRDQLIQLGIDPARIWTIPYGADPAVFPHSDRLPGDGFRIVFAGQVGIRKGLKSFLDALTLVGQDNWRVDFYGAKLGESSTDLAAYQGRVPLHFHGPVSQRELASAFATGSVMVLASLEEGFGLVVPQALSCGLPSIVSDRVGGKDLVRHRENGSIFAANNAQALAEELVWWSQHPKRVRETFRWSDAAESLINLSRSALS